MNGKQFEVTGGEKRAVLTVAGGHEAQARVYEGPEYPAIDVTIDGLLGVVVEYMPSEGWMIRVFGPDQEEPVAKVAFVPSLKPAIAQMLER